MQSYLQHRKINQAVKRRYEDSSRGENAGLWRPLDQTVIGGQSQGLLNLRNLRMLEANANTYTEKDLTHPRVWKRKRRQKLTFVLFNGTITTDTLAPAHTVLGRNRP